MSLANRTLCASTSVGCTSSPGTHAAVQTRGAAAHTVQAVGGQQWSSLHVRSLVILKWNVLVINHHELLLKCIHFYIRSSVVIYLYLLASTFRRNCFLWKSDNLPNSCLGGGKIPSVLWAWVSISEKLCPEKKPPQPFNSRLFHWNKTMCSLNLWQILLQQSKTEQKAFETSLCVMGSIKKKRIWSKINYTVIIGTLFLIPI